MSKDAAPRNVFELLAALLFLVQVAVFALGVGDGAVKDGWAVRWIPVWTFIAMVIFMRAGLIFCPDSKAIRFLLDDRS